MSVIDRIGIGGLWITVRTSSQPQPQSRLEQPQSPRQLPADESVAHALVWRSVRSGSLLTRGRPLTQQQAIHAILTHSRNEIIAAETTPTRIAYRTPNVRPWGSDSVTTYEGSPPGATHQIPTQPKRADTTGSDETRHRSNTEQPAISIGTVTDADDLEATAAAIPTMVAAQSQTPPVATGMRYRVWHQPLENADHAAETFDDQFFIQTATLAEAVQLERVLEAYDTWTDRNGDHDIEVWDGTAWTSDLAPAALAAAQGLLQRIYHLDDITVENTGRRGAVDADPT